MSSCSVRTQRVLASATLEVLEYRQLLSAIAGHVSAVSDGDAIEGIQVNLYCSSNPDSAGDDAWGYLATDNTDALGNYLFENLEEGRHYRVRVEDGSVGGTTHYLSADIFNVVATGDVTATELHLREAGVLTGHVYDSSGHAIANAQVLTEASWTSDGETDWHTAYTDSNGRYELYLPATDQRVYPLKVLEAPVAGTTDKFYAVKIAPDLYAATVSGATGYDFRLSLGGTITGYAVSDTGEPIAYIDVVEGATHIQYGMFEDPNGYTNAEGFYSLHGVPAGTPIYLRTDGWDWGDFAIGEDHFGMGERLLGPFTVSAGGTLQIPDIVVRKAGSVTGTIFGSNGLPVVGATIKVIGTDVDGGSVYLEDGEIPLTDPLGQFNAAAVPPGRYRVIASKVGWAQSISGELLVISGQATHCDLTLQQATSSEAFTVSGKLTNYLDIAPKTSGGQFLPVSLIDYEDYDRNSGVGVVAVAQGTIWTTTDFLNPEVHFSGQTEFTDGYSDYYGFDATSAGQYRLDLPAGAQSLVVFRNVATGLGTWQVILSDPLNITGSGGDDLTLDLTAPVGNSTISGTVTLPSGYDLSNIDGPESGAIWLKDMNAPNSPLGRAGGSVNSAGQYALKNIPAGTYTLYLVFPGLQPQVSATFTIAANSTLVRNFSLTYGAKAVGRVVVDDGATDPTEQTGIANVVVRSTKTGYTTITDDDGNFTLTGLLDGEDTLLLQCPGYASYEVAVSLVTGHSTSANASLAPASASITGIVAAPSRISDGLDNDGDEEIDEADEQFFAGATVVAYNADLDKSYVGYTSDDGAYSFQGLPAGNYRLIATANGYDSAVYPGDDAPLSIADAAEIDLTGATDWINLQLSPPHFSVTSSLEGAKLSITIYSDLPLAAMPTLSIEQGSGTLGGASVIDSRSAYVEYTLGEGDSIVQLSVAEDPEHPLVADNPASRTFSFDVSGDLQELQSTTFYNAQGASANIMGTQDHASVYIPPMAVVTGDNELATATTLTVTRYGSPGQTLDSSHTSITSSYDFVLDDNGNIEGVRLAHEATLTMTFTVPPGISEAQFRQTLRVGFYNTSEHKWVWNDLSNTNPDSGISDISINWLSNTLTFKAAHFTKFALSVVPVNKAPTALSLSKNTMLQNWPKGTVIGTFTATDPNAGDTITYSLVSGSGSANNSLFSISGNLLKVNSKALYSGKTYSIRVQAKDAGGLKYQKPLTIRVTGINTAPTKLTLSRTTIAENREAGTTVGTFAATDRNSGESFTYKFVSGTGSANNSIFTISGNQLKTRGVFNYEAKQLYSIRVAAVDRGGMSYAKAFTIGVTNVNEAPTGVSLSPRSVLENKPIGTLVGRLTGSDPDAGSILTYSFVSDEENGDDNDLFTIVGNQLRTNSDFDFELQDSYHILVQVKDQRGLFCSQPIPFTITIGDVMDDEVV